VEPLEIQTNGDQAFVWVRFSGHGAESGVPIVMEMAHVNTVADGKLRSIEEYQERADGLKAAGVPE
jgi:ketosteroid isomerase-like protein